MPAEFEIPALHACVCNCLCGSQDQVSNHVFEYQWPPNDRSAEWFLLQEHISEFLGVVSFKRKYPGNLTLCFN